MLSETTMLFCASPVHMLIAVLLKYLAGIATSVYLTMPSNLFLYHLTVSLWSMRWEAPIRDFARLRLATRSPGRVLHHHCQHSLPTCPEHAALYSHAAVEVHAVDTNRRVVLDAEIDVLRDTEAEVAGLGEVALPQLVLLDLEATLEDLLCLGAADGDVDGDLLVTTDTECADSVASLACKPSVSALMPCIICSSRVAFALALDGEGRTVDWCLTAQLLEHLRRSRQPITRLADGDVQDELLDLELAHWISGLGGALGLLGGLW